VFLGASGKSIAVSILATSSVKALMCENQHQKRGKNELSSETKQQVRMQKLKPAQARR